MPLILTKKINKNVIYFFLVGCLFILKDVFILDISGILDQINFFFGILITYISAKYLPMHRGNIKFVMMMYIFYLLVFTAIIRPESVSFSFNSARFFIANVHGYGLSFVFILLVYLYAFNIRSTPANLKHIAALSLIAILIIATGSRTAIYTSIFILTSLFFERFKPFQNNIFRFFVAFVFFIAIYVIVYYLTDIFLIFESGYIYDVLGVKHIGNNFSSGRDWLWAYHAELFYNNMFFGVNNDVLNWAPGDYIGDNVKAFAGSESLYSKYLAADGLLGIFKIYIYIYIVWFALKTGSYHAYLVSSALLIANSSLTVLGNAYSFHYIMYSLFFWSLVLYRENDFNYLGRVAVKKNKITEYNNI